MPITTDNGKREITAEHKQAMAIGRKQSKIVDRYLTCVQDARPKKGRPRTVESVQAQLADVESELKQNPSPVTRLGLLSRQKNLQGVLKTLEEKTEIDELEKQFIEVAGEFSERKNINLAAWRESGVPMDVLEKAGISK